MGTSKRLVADEYVLDSENFNTNTLKDLSKKFSITTNGTIQEGTRGYVIWLVARNQDELAKFRSESQKVLDDAFPEEDPLPFVIMLPSNPNLELLDALKREKALNFSRKRRGKKQIRIFIVSAAGRKKPIFLTRFQLFEAEKTIAIFLLNLPNTLFIAHTKNISKNWAR